MFEREEVGLSHSDEGRFVGERKVAEIKIKSAPNSICRPRSNGGGGNCLTAARYPLDASPHEGKTTIKKKCQFGEGIIV